MTAKIIPFPLNRARATVDSTIRMCEVLLAENKRIEAELAAALGMSVEDFREIPLDELDLEKLP